MAAIRLLSEEMINKIAAGEVVERPASVLKELLENSLDAGADRIEIDTEAGGRRLVMVADNGCGLDPDDLLLSVERHATSKISTDADLLRIATLGFRGEALSSIGAVSRLTITAAAARDGRARQVVMSGGRMIKVEDASRDRGATVEVRDLFFNVPARRKFLKSIQTESAHLLETAQRYTLGCPALRLVYRANGQELLATNPMEDGLTRVSRVLGRDAARAMSPFEGEQNGLRASGFLGDPAFDRSRAGGLYLYVNGRPVSDRLLTRSVMEAYRGRLAHGRYPVAVVYLEIDPELVDVNVHPAKAEVRFRQPSEVFNAAVEIMGTALSRQHRPLRAPAAEYTETPAFQRAPVLAESMLWESPPPFGPPPALTYRDPAPAFAQRPAGAAAVTPELPGLRPLAQLFNSYILAQGPDALYIVDQHAAHERILYERLQSQLGRGTLPSQALLLPQPLELTPVQAAVLNRLAAELGRFGFDLEHFGGQTFVLRAVPMALAGRESGRAISDIIEAMETHRPEAGLDDLEQAMLSSLACHAAIKAGEPMTLPEMEQLLADLDRTRVPTHCPHGRPLIFNMDRQDIEKRFKRA